MLLGLLKYFMNLESNLIKLLPEVTLVSPFLHNLVENLSSQQISGAELILIILGFLSRLRHSDIRRNFSRVNDRCQIICDITHHICLSLVERHSVSHAVIHFNHVFG